MHWWTNRFDWQSWNRMPIITEAGTRLEMWLTSPCLDVLSASFIEHVTYHWTGIIEYVLGPFASSTCRAAIPAVTESTALEAGGVT